MTTKEKAEELTNSFIELKSKKISDDSRIEFPTAKQCALIAVDEILYYDNQFIQTELQYDYWKEVKQEIEKL